MLRLTVVALGFLYLAANVVLAGVYVDRLVHPGCVKPAPLANVRAPEVTILLTKDGVQLEGWYYPPENGAVILALGGLEGALGAAHPPIAFLIENGYGVLQIGSRSCAGEPVTVGGYEVEDALTGLRVLQDKPDVQRIGVFGYSMGGVMAIRAAAVEEGFEAVVAEGGYFNLGEDIVEAGSRQSPAERVLLYSIAGMFWLRTGVNPWEISPVDVIGRISPRPLFLVYGEREKESGRADLQFGAAGEPKFLWIVPGGDHGSNHRVASAEYEARILKFFDTWLLNREDGG